jgi:hypothetical protein
MKLRIKRISTPVSLKKFRDLIARPDIDLDYLKHSVTIGLYNDDNLIAGYSIRSLPLNQMHSIKQIPVEMQLGDEDPFNYTELLGYFINTNKYAWLITTVMALHLILCRKRDYILYLHMSEMTCGNPYRIYSGISVDGKQINVDIYTKPNLRKIYFNFIKSILFKKV